MFDTLVVAVLVSSSVVTVVVVFMFMMIMMFMGIIGGFNIIITVTSLAFLPKNEIWRPNSELRCGRVFEDRVAEVGTCKHCSTTGDSTVYGGCCFC